MNWTKSRIGSKAETLLKINQKDFF